MWTELRYQILGLAAYLLRIPLGPLLYDETEAELEPNPFATQETADIIRRTLDVTASAVWPIVHQDQSRAILCTMPILSYQLHLFQGLDLDAFKAGGWELSRLYAEWLDPDTDPGSLLGADWEQDRAGGGLKTEIFAFISESLDRDPHAAVQIFDNMFHRYADPSDGAFRVSELYTHLVLSLAHRYSLDVAPEIADMIKGDD